MASFPRPSISSSSSLVLEVAVDLRDLALFDENVPAGQKLSGLENGDVFYQHQRKIAAKDKKIIE